MYNLFRLSQTTSQRPSNLADIDVMCADALGEPSSWIAYQFDSAVTWFGQYVEGKALETTEGGKPRYDLDTLLRTKAENTALSLAKAAKRGYVEDRR